MAWNFKIWSSTLTWGFHSESWTETFRNCYVVSTAQKMKFLINDFFSKYDQESVDLGTFTEEIINGKLHFLCNVT